MTLYGGTVPFIVAHGASGPFDEAIEVVFCVALVLGFRAILRALGKAEDEEAAVAGQDRAHEP